MPNIQIDPRLVSVAIAELPALIAWIRGAFHHANPDAPVPTEAQVLSAYEYAKASSLAKDDAWLKAHPAP